MTPSIQHFSIQTFPHHKHTGKITAKYKKRMLWGVCEVGGGFFDHLSAMSHFFRQANVTRESKGDNKEWQYKVNLISLSSQCQS